MTNNVKNTSNIKQVYQMFQCYKSLQAEKCNYRKIANSNTTRLEAHVGLFRLLMKGIFGPYVLLPYVKKLIFQISNAH